MKSVLQDRPVQSCTLDTDLLKVNSTETVATTKTFIYFYFFLESGGLYFFKKIFFYFYFSHGFVFVFIIC